MSTTGKAHHDGTQWGKLIVEGAGFLDIASLEGHLQTAAAHTEAHCVHVDVILQCRIRVLLQRQSVLILEYWKLKSETTNLKLFKYLNISFKHGNNYLYIYSLYGNTNVLRTNFKSYEECREKNRIRFVYGMF